MPLAMSPRSNNTGAPPPRAGATPSTSNNGGNNVNAGNSGNNNNGGGGGGDSGNQSSGPIPYPPYMVNGNGERMLYYPQQQYQPFGSSDDASSPSNFLIRNAGSNNGFFTPGQQQQQQSAADSGYFGALYSPDHVHRAAREYDVQRFNMAGGYVRTGGDVGDGGIVSSIVGGPTTQLRFFMYLCALYWIAAAMCMWTGQTVPLVSWFPDASRYAFQDKLTAGFAMIVSFFMLHAASFGETVPVACASYFGFGIIMLLVGGSADLAEVTHDKVDGFLSLHIMHATLFFAKGVIILSLYFRACV